MEVNVATGGAAETVHGLVSTDITWIGWDLGPRLLKGTWVPGDLCPFPFPHLPGQGAAVLLGSSGHQTLLAPIFFLLFCLVGIWLTLRVSPTEARVPPAVARGTLRLHSARSRPAPLLSLWDQCRDAESGALAFSQAREQPWVLADTAPSAPLAEWSGSSPGPQERKGAVGRWRQCPPHKHALQGERAWRQRPVWVTSWGPKRADEVGAGYLDSDSVCGGDWVLAVFCGRDWPGAGESSVPSNWATF